MKKFLSLTLMAVLMLSCLILLVGCTSAEDKLLGVWESKNPSNSIYDSITFTKSDNKHVAILQQRYSYGTVNLNAEYLIEDNKIFFIFKSGYTDEAVYFVRGNTLVVDGHEYTKK